jgi:hypothetical protein
MERTPLDGPAHSSMEADRSGEASVLGIFTGGKIPQTASTNATTRPGVLRSETRMNWFSHIRLIVSLGASGQSPAKKLSMGQAASPSSWKMPRIAP